MKVLIDKNVNFKELKRFVRDNKISCEIHGLNVEQKNKKINEKPGLAVLGGPGKFPYRLGDKNTEEIFSDIKRIVGKQNIGDCLHVESAISEGFNIIITEDRDILENREELIERFLNLDIKKLEDFKNDEIKKSNL